MIKAAGSTSPAPWTGVGDRLEKRVQERFGRGADSYVPPTPAEQDAFRGLVRNVSDALRQNDAALWKEAKRGAAALGYQMEGIRQDGQTFLMLAEQTRGWPTVIFNIRPSSGLVLEVPHPLFDYSTPELGWRALQTFGADALIVAGAHRANRSEPSPDVPHGPNLPEYSVSDMSHTRGTLFQAAHQALSGPQSVVLQLHGFTAAAHHAKVPDFPADTQFVLSDGADDDYDPPSLRASQQALQAAGFKSHIVTFETEATSQLSAQLNVQHADMDERGLVGRGKSAEFVHMEIDRSLRAGPNREASFDRILETLRPVFSPEALQARQRLLKLQQYIRHAYARPAAARTPAPPMRGTGSTGPL